MQMNRKALLASVILSGVTGALLGQINAVAERAAVSPDGSDLLLWVVPLILVPAFFMGYLLIPIGGLMCFSSRLRGTGVTLAASGAAYMLSMVGSCSTGSDVRIRAFEKVAVRGDVIVKAIEQYAEKNGNPPRELEGLVPEYLADIPGTGIGAYPNFEYVAAEAGGDVYGSRWMPYVHCPSGGINFDRFVYLPNGDYSAYDSWGWIEPVGDWAYVHE